MAKPVYMKKIYLFNVLAFSWLSIGAQNINGVQLATNISPIQQTFANNSINLMNNDLRTDNNLDRGGPDIQNFTKNNPVNQKKIIQQNPTTNLNVQNDINAVNNFENNLGNTLDNVPVQKNPNKTIQVNHVNEYQNLGSNTNNSVVKVTINNNNGSKSFASEKKFNTDKKLKKGFKNIPSSSGHKHKKAKSKRRPSFAKKKYHTSKCETW